MKFESYEAAPGDFRWRVRDEQGAVARIRPGRIMGLGRAADLKPYEQAVNTVLARLAGKKGAVRRKRAARARQN